MCVVNAEQLKAIAGKMSDKLIETYLPLINEYSSYGGVATPVRMSAFLAQILHESVCFAYTAEIASGEAYEGRKDLGNVHPGDGKKYKGRGLIQITGRANYELLAKEWNMPELVDNPDLLRVPIAAVKSAYWFWNKHKLNELADKHDFISITKKINGGTNGLAKRQAFYLKALTALHAA